jgi:hypothetical protein
MYSKLVKYSILIAVLSLSISDKVFSQSFYQDYKAYLINSWGKRIKPANKKSIDELIRRLRKAIDANEKQNNLSFFNVDTIYIVHFSAAETVRRSSIAWSKRTSCYYSYSFENIIDGKRTNEKLDIDSNASTFLNSFNHSFRKAIETGDMKAYYNYESTHEVSDGEWVSPTICIKQKGHWKFIPFKGTGGTIIYNFELPVKN